MDVRACVDELTAETFVSAMLLVRQYWRTSNSRHIQASVKQAYQRSLWGRCVHNTLNPFTKRVTRRRAVCTVNCVRGNRFRMWNWGSGDADVQLLAGVGGAVRSGAAHERMHD